jgi:hypothetical protein
LLESVPVVRDFLTLPSFLSKKKNRSNTSVFCAIKKTTERQIADLLALKRTHDAVLLAENALQQAKPGFSGPDPRERALAQLLQTLSASGDGNIIQNPPTNPKKITFCSPAWVFCFLSSCVF